ncbi:ATP-binding protein [Streptomyces sp. NPDC050619]|uniref:ATP-binding protein n=1 Tax=Streptomyces sp. NPDC050619 TaxID=3157214 RepID=UPI00343F6099
MSPHTTPSPQLPDFARPERTHWIELPAHRSSVRVARHSMNARMAAWHLPSEVSADAELLMSELAANAVCHTPSRQILCGMGLVTDHRLRLEVHDHDYAGASLSRCRPGPDDESGRGLFLVQEIAHTWGVDRSRLTGGNAVWATLITSA